MFRYKLIGKPQDGFDRDTLEENMFAKFHQRLIMAPTSNHVRLWLSFVWASVVYVTFRFPFLMAFSVEVDEFESFSTTFFDAFVELVFIFDVFVGFCVAYVEDGIIVHDFPSMAKHYARSNLLYDILVAFPYFISSIALFISRVRRGQTLHNQSISPACGIAPDRENAIEMGTQERTRVRAEEGKWEKAAATGAPVPWLARLALRVDEWLERKQQTA